MALGSAIFNNLFSEIESIPVIRERKGRSLIHDQKRNELLLYRYLYYGAYTEKRWEKILAELENEFFLSQRRINDIIQQNTQWLRERRQDMPTKAWLNAKYPHMKW